MDTVVRYNSKLEIIVGECNHKAISFAISKADGIKSQTLERYFTIYRYRLKPNDSPSSIISGKMCKYIMITRMRKFFGISLDGKFFPEFQFLDPNSHSQSHPLVIK